MISVERLTVRLGGRNVVDDISTMVGAGRITAIIGPNGAGKTSLLRAMAGLVGASSGSVCIGGIPITDLTPAERGCRIGYLPQDGEPAWNITAFELASLGRLPHLGRLSQPSSGDEDAIHAALVATDTARLARRTIGTLSGGERARVKMARVLAGAPDWILADEPLANLDPPHQRDMLSLFRSAAQSGTGIVTVLHQLDAAAAADDVLILKDGRLIGFGPARTVLTPENLDSAFDMAFDVFDHRGRFAILPRA